MQLQSDERERVKEALVAVLTAALRPSQAQPQDDSKQPGAVSAGGAGWLNPGEEQMTVDEGVEMLGGAITAYRSQNVDEHEPTGDNTAAADRSVGRGPIRMLARIVNAFGTCGALEAATDAILGIGPTQQTLAAVAQLPEHNCLSATSEDLFAPDQQASTLTSTVIGQQKTLAEANRMGQRPNWLIRTLGCSQRQHGGALLCVEHLGKTKVASFLCPPSTLDSRIVASNRR